MAATHGAPTLTWKELMIYHITTKMTIQSFVLTAAKNKELYLTKVGSLMALT